MSDDCVTCWKIEGRPYRPPPPPPLPDFQVKMGPPFAHTGVDFAGPLYVKGTPVDMFVHVLCRKNGSLGNDPGHEFSNVPPKF